MEDPKDPDKCNIFALYKLFSTEEQIADLAAKYRAGNFGYGHAKQALFDAYMDYFAPMRKRREELEKDPAYIEEVLRKGAEKANEVASQTLDEVRRAVGLR
jgi:tryptophanyl-tRNA synthetase